VPAVVFWPLNSGRTQTQYRDGSSTAPFSACPNNSVRIARRNGLRILRRRRVRSESCFMQLAVGQGLPLLVGLLVAAFNEAHERLYLQYPQ
jgi:hypothetical protein